MAVAQEATTSVFWQGNKSANGIVQRADLRGCISASITPPWPSSTSVSNPSCSNRYTTPDILDRYHVTDRMIHVIRKTIAFETTVATFAGTARHTPHSRVAKLQQNQQYIYLICITPCLTSHWPKLKFKSACVDPCLAERPYEGQWVFPVVPVGGGRVSLSSGYVIAFPQMFVPVTGTPGDKVWLTFG